MMVNAVLCRKIKSQQAQILSHVKVEPKQAKNAHDWNEVAKIYPRSDPYHGKVFNMLTDFESM